MVYFSTFRHVVNDFLVKYIHSSHFFVDLGEVLDVLTCVLDHTGGEGPSLPKLFIVLHGAVNFVFFVVDLAQVVFEQVVEADVNVSVVVLLKEVGD